MGGKRETQIISPQAPPAPSTADAIREFVQQQPRLFELQQQQAPQEAQLQLDLLQQFGEPLGQAVRDAQRSINPELTDLQDELAGIARQRANEGLTDTERESFLNQFKSLVGNQVSAPIGASFIGKELLEQDLLARQSGMNLGLSLSGQQPIAQPLSPTTNNFGGSFTPGQVLNANSSNFGSRLGFSQPIAVQQPSAFQRFGQDFSAVGQIAGGIGSMFGALGGI